VSVHRILGAVRDRIHVARRAANRVARGYGQRRAKQDYCRYFLEHLSSPVLTEFGNAAIPERLHSARVLFATRAAESQMRKAGLISILLLGGCFGHTGIRPLRPLEIPLAPYREVATTALTGSMMYEGGCLLFHDEQSAAILKPVWPAGTTFNGSAVLFHQPAKADQWVTVAQEFLMYGQPLQWPTLGAPTYQPFHQECGAYRPFFVTSVRPAN
jgi:hypothetical protein